MKNAIEMMPAKIYPKGSDMTGHATKYAAEAMMARVFLFYTGRYEKNELPNGTTKEEVISWIDDCVNNSGHKRCPTNATSGPTPTMLPKTIPKGSVTNTLSTIT
ncbi:hypothetical protein NXX09_06890 [Bacteroides uniformis]|nr:hypothetical protein [Bacteroides uniformis]